jgi:hypothetical protein
VPLSTLVTLEWTPVDIATSVIRGGAWVYSPPVLHPQVRTRSEELDIRNRAGMQDALAS